MGPLPFGSEKLSRSVGSDNREGEADTENPGCFSIPNSNLDVGWYIRRPTIERNRRN